MELISAEDPRNDTDEERRKKNRVILIGLALSLFFVVAPLLSLFA